MDKHRVEDIPVENECLTNIVIPKPAVEKRSGFKKPLCQYKRSVMPVQDKGSAIG